MPGSPVGIAFEYIEFLHHAQEVVGRRAFLRIERPEDSALLKRPVGAAFGMVRRRER